jgi:cytoskeletal protein RodZ
MSLINEALKKAQKLRTGDPAGTIAPMPGGTPRVTKRGEPRTTQQLVLIAAGALVLVVLSVVATFWFVNRAPAPKPASKPIAVKPADSSAPSPTIVAPTIKAPAPVTETPPVKTETAPAPVATTPAPGTQPATTPPPVVKPTTTVAEAPAQSAPAPAVATEPVAPASTPTPLAQPVAQTPPPAAAPVATDPRVHAFVDSVKVGGIRSSSGGDSRVLMNDRVFRVNDIVERNLGVRLTKVEPSALTFTDSNGAVYVKNF